MQNFVDLTHEDDETSIIDLCSDTPSQCSSPITEVLYGSLTGSNNPSDPCYFPPSSQSMDPSDPRYESWFMSHLPPPPTLPINATIMEDVANLSQALEYAHNIIRFEKISKHLYDHGYEYFKGTWCTVFKHYVNNLEEFNFQLESQCNHRCYHCEFPEQKFILPLGLTDHDKVIHICKHCHNPCNCHWRLH